MDIWHCRPLWTNDDFILQVQRRVFAVITCEHTSHCRPPLTLAYSSHIELGSAKEADIEALIDACMPATFSRGSENVLDERYQKALKLDAGNFSWLFNPDSARFVAELARGLCPWDSLDRGIRIEPCKLNVYGETAASPG